MLPVSSKFLRPRQQNKQEATVYSNAFLHPILKLH